MAYNPYFTFADPALQQAVVQEAQIQAAAQAAQAQQRAQTLAAMRQERQAAAEREERRAIREGDIRAREATAAEQRRQFGETLGFSREELASREKIAGSTERLQEQQAKDREQVGRYNILLRQIERADAENLPTESELEARITDFTPERKEALRATRRQAQRNLSSAYGLVKDEETRLNAILDRQEKDLKTGLVRTPDELIAGSPAKSQLRINPKTGRVEGLLKAPRADAVLEPQEAATPTFHVPIGRPAESILDVQNRLTGAAPRRPPLATLGRAAFGLPGVASLAGELFSGRRQAQPFVPPVPSAPATPGFLERASDFVTGRLLPPIASRLNRMEIGPDLTGYFPQYPITSPPLPIPPRIPEYATDEDFLAPPQFFVPPGY